MNDSRKSGQSRLLLALFVILVVAALGLVGWYTIIPRVTDWQYVRRELPQVRADVISELEEIGLARSPVLEEDGSIRFGHPPSVSSNDLILLLRQIMRRHDLVMTAAVEYEEQQELYIELRSSGQLLVVRLIFAPMIGGEGLAGVQGRIGIIIDDFGYIYNRLTAGFMALSEKVTFSVIPGHSYSQILADEADRYGHEVIVHMPMEPENYNGRDEEGYILLYGMDKGEIQARVRRAFQEVPQAVGMNNHEGSLATLDTVLLDVLAAELEMRNMYFVDSYTTSKTRALDVMRARGVPSIGRNVFLDNEDDPEYIRGQIAILAESAERNGAAIGIGHVGSNHLHTLDVLLEEIPKLKARGFEFLFISEVINYVKIRRPELISGQ